MKETRPLELTKTSDPFRADVAAHIGKSVLVKGELSGSEDLYLDGEVEGTIELRDHSLIVGPNGRVRANISAREVVLHGKAEGNIHGTDRVELKKSCVLVGDITTQRIVIEDGAFFKGSVEQKESKPEPKKAMAAAAAASPSPSYSAPANPVLTPQASLLEQK
jgi:cytoskeletal protein CcmA (bactofilin family)